MDTAYEGEAKDDEEEELERETEIGDNGTARVSLGLSRPSEGGRVPPVEVASGESDSVAEESEASSGDAEESEDEQPRKKKNNKNRQDRLQEELPEEECRHADTHGMHCSELLYMPVACNQTAGHRRGG